MFANDVLDIMKSGEGFLKITAGRKQLSTGKDVLRDCQACGEASGKDRHLIPSVIRTECKLSDSCLLIPDYRNASGHQTRLLISGTT